MAIEKMTDSRPRLGRAAALAAFALICSVPYARWMAQPCLFDDDFLRVGSLRRSGLAESLFRPFNEHMAPLFEVVSWLAWQASGRDIRAIPAAFGASSMIAFGLTVGLLAALIRRELQSGTAALAAVALFCLSSVSAETVLWFSASSFQWAASATLAAWLAAAIGSGTSTGRRGLPWLAASGLAALAAPAFSAIGLLAGPLATLRVFSAVDGPRSMARRLGLSVLPSLGTAAYVLICQHFRYGDLVSASVHRNFSPGAALWATLRAPSAVQAPALVGLPDLAGRLPAVFLAGSTVVGLVVSLIWAVRSRHRPQIVGGVALIVGGYASAYATRARPGDLWIFEIQRYHLFPQIGLVFLIVAAIAPRLRRIDANPGLGICLVAVLAALHYPGMEAVAEKGFRFPEQPQVLAATARLESACEREGITEAQLMVALEPIRTRWFPHPAPFNPLINLLPVGPATARLAEDRVRPTLLAAMSPADREALFGGMEATRQRIPASHLAGSRPPVVARAVTNPRVRPVEVGRYRVEGWPGVIEFEVGRDADEARALCLPGPGVARRLEVWWAGEGEGWSPGRSVRWSPDPGHPGTDWGVPLDRLPHWRRGEVRRLRLICRDPGPIELAAPRFLP